MLDSNGPVAVLVDLPGYGYAKLPKAMQSDIGAQARPLHCIRLGFS